MNNQIKMDYRAAADILQSLSGVRQSQPFTALDESVMQCRRWQQRLESATRRNWPTAAKDTADRLRGALDILRMRASHAIDDLHRRSQSRLVPTATSIYRDLEALRSEFEGVAIDRAKQKLTVQTSSITLEDVQLGSFEIHLNWKYIQETSPFDVTAVDPHPPASSASIPHPHVRDDSLCEGEGSDAIRRALSDGRIYDFFCIVEQILRTYNAGSAYVSLSDWDGVTCHDCGQSVDPDEARCCYKCEQELCEECSTSCCDCSDSYCSDCVSPCHGCGDDCCYYCLKSCDDCGEKFCHPCLNEGICDDCTHQQNEAKAEAEAEQQAEQSSAAV